MPPGVVTLEELKAALRATLGKRGISAAEIDDLADYLLSFFGHQLEVVDNKLDTEDRDVFYMLEEAGLLTTRQEEVLIRKGKLWRIHYWVLRADHIKDLARRAQDLRLEPEISIYETIGDEAWQHRT